MIETHESSERAAKLTFFLLVLGTLSIVGFLEITTAKAPPLWYVDLSCEDDYHNLTFGLDGPYTTFTVKIENGLAKNDTYELTASSIENIRCAINRVYADQYSPYIITLDASESTAFEVGAVVGVVPPGEWPIIVTAASQNHSSINDTLTLTVNVVKREPMPGPLPTPVLSCEDAHHNVTPGSYTTFFVKIANGMPANDTYEIFTLTRDDIICSIDGSYMNQSNAYVISLEEFQNTTFRVEAKVGGTVSKGIWTITVVAVSQDHTDLNDAIHLSVNVHQVYGYKGTVTDRITGKTLEGVNVTLSFIEQGGGMFDLGKIKGNVSQLTDSNGIYSIFDFPVPRCVCDWYLIANKTGYKEERRKVYSPGSKILYENFSLSPLYKIETEEEGTPQVPMRFETIAIGAALGIGIVALCLASRTEVVKYAIFSAFIPLYVKLRKEEIQDQETRGKIIGYIKAKPGTHYNEIKRELELNNGTLAYHLWVLLREELIKTRREGMYKRFYPYSMIVRQEEEDILSPTQKNIVAILKSKRNAFQTQKEIGEKTGLSQQTISYNLKKLNEYGYLEVDARNGIIYYRLSSEFRGELLLELCPYCQYELVDAKLTNYCPNCGKPVKKSMDA